MKINTKRTDRLIALSTLSFAGVGSAAVAQEAGEVETVALKEIEIVGQALYTDQVTALKTPTPIIDVPQSLSITTAEDIAFRGFNSVGDIVQYTPGVSMSQGEGHRDAIVFRGVRSTADFFVDGVRDDVQYYRPLYNVQQVEILRGSNALLFGRGGAGGILNRVTKKGVIGGSFNDYTLSVDTFGAFGAQIDSNVGIDDGAAVRINAYYESLENHRDFYDGDNFGINPTVKFLLGEATTVDVSYEYLDHKRFIDRGIPTGDDFEPVDALDTVVFGSSELNETTLEAQVIRAILQHKFSDGLRGNLTTSFGDYDKVYQNLFASAYAESSNTVTLDGYRDTTDRQNAVLSGNLISEFETGDISHTVIFGAEYINTSSNQDRYNTVWTTSETDKESFIVTSSGDFNVTADGDPTSVSYSSLNDDTSVELDVYSFFVQDEIQLTDQLTVVLGARFDSFDIEVDDHEPGGTDGSQKDEEITPRAGIVFKPQENISIYASYSETFVPQSGEQYANLGDEGLDPDFYTNLEAGVKWDLTQGLSLTAAIFEIEQDLVEDDGSGGSRSLETTFDGFELQLAGYITDNWYISAGYSYQEGELDDGNTPRELPESLFSIWNRYQLTGDLFLGLGAIYQDESYMTNDEDTQLPDFVRFDAAASYQINENLRLQVRIENLLDEPYYPHAHSDHQASVGAPVNARFSITGSF
ncbi:MAG: TonB-dependent receptor [Lentimonas sp.]